MVRWSARAVRLLLLASLPVLPGAGPREARVYLSAGAPWGEPGARGSFPTACDDTIRCDTLYLSFEPAADDTGFLAVQGELDIHAQPGDTLGSFWSLARGGANNGGLIMQFGPDASFPQPQPWPVAGVGSVLYERTALTGRFRFVFALPENHPGTVRAGTRYVLGRLVLRAKHPGLGGCERPVCIEWRDASVGFKGMRKMLPVPGEADRWLSRGAPESACRGRVPAWMPRRMGGTGAPPPPDSLR